MDLAQILCNGVQSGEDRAGIKYRSAETKHRGILRSCSRVNAECLPLISSVPLRLSGSKLQSLHFCLAHCRAKKTKNRNRNTHTKKKTYPKANMRREVRTDSLTHKSTSPFGTSGRPTFVNVEFLPKYARPCTAPGLETWSTPNKHRNSTGVPGTTVFSYLVRQCRL